jgi:hypothetical protein
VRDCARQDDMVRSFELMLRLRLLGDVLSFRFLMVPLVVTCSAAANAAFDTSFKRNRLLGPLTPAVPVAGGNTRSAR